jgi:hypothetical protein
MDFFNTQIINMEIGWSFVRVSLAQISCILFSSFGLLVARTPPAGAANSRARSNTLVALRPGHLRLYLLDSDLPQVKKAIAVDPVIKEWYDELQGEAEKMLTEPPAEYKLIGPRLLSQSRAALRRISTLAGLYRLDGDLRKAERAHRELLAISAFPDWHPPHFLDTAEMIHAAAIGYDWLYRFLPPHDRAVVQKAIVEKGLNAGLRVYASGGRWTRTEFIGIRFAMAALPSERSPSRMRSRQSQAKFSRLLAPRFPWQWLRSGRTAAGQRAPATGTTQPLTTPFTLRPSRPRSELISASQRCAALTEAGLFRIHTTGPLGLTFNYGDSRPHAGAAPQMFWLAKEFARPVYAWSERRMTGKIVGWLTAPRLIWWAGA